MKENVIPINPPASTRLVLQERLDNLKAQGLRHSLSKTKKEKRKHQSVGEKGEEKVEKKRRNSTMRDTVVSDTVKLVQKITSQQTGGRSATVASIFNTGEAIVPARWNDTFGVGAKMH